MSFYVVDVALPVPLLRTFDYLPVEGDARENYQPGQRVRADFGKQLLTGIVLGTRDTSEAAGELAKLSLSLGTLVAKFKI